MLENANVEKVRRFVQSQWRGVEPFRTEIIHSARSLFTERGLSIKVRETTKKRKRRHVVERQKALMSAIFGGGGGIGLYRCFVWVGDSGEYECGKCAS